MKASKSIKTAVAVSFLKLSVCCSVGGAASPTSSSAISFLGSNLASGSMITVEDCDGGCTDALTTRYSVVPESDFPEGASLNIKLLDSSGKVCAFDWTRSARLASGTPTLFESDFLVLKDGQSNYCPFPIETSFIQATLVGDQTGRPHYLERQFQVRYTFLARPASAAPTRPEITAFDWDAEGPTGYHACPYPDERILMSCAVEDPDGDGLIMSIDWKNAGSGALGPGPMSVSKTFPPSTYARRLSASFFMREVTSVRATCSAVDSRGWSAPPASFTIACGR